MKVKMNKVFPTLVKNIWHCFMVWYERLWLIKVSNNSMENDDTRNSVIFNNKLLDLQNLVSEIAPTPHTHTHK